MNLDSAVKYLEGAQSALGVSSYLREPKFLEQSIELDRRHLKENLSVSKDHHIESVSVSFKQHRDSVELDQKTHIRAVAHSLEEHLHELNADLIYSTREAERSMYDQRNAEFQTLIISSTVMFSGLSTVIIQGYLPHPATASNGLAVIYILMAGACGLSFAFLFIGIVLFMKIVVRTSKFMYQRSNRETRRVMNAIRNSTNMLKDIRKQKDIFSNDVEWKRLSMQVFHVHDGIIKSFLEDEHIHHMVDSSNGWLHANLDTSIRRNRSMTLRDRLSRAFALRLPLPFGSPKATHSTPNESSGLRTGKTMQSCATYGSLRSLDEDGSSVDSRAFQDADDGDLENALPVDNSQDEDEDEDDRDGDGDGDGSGGGGRRGHPVLSWGCLRSPTDHNTRSASLFLGEDEGDDGWSDEGETKSNTNTSSPLVGRNGDRFPWWRRSSLVSLFGQTDRSEDTRPGSFEHFYESHCQLYARIAFWMFYMGTSAFQISCAVFMYAQFSVMYENMTGAIASVVFVGISLVIGLVIVIYMDDECIHELVDIRNNTSPHEKCKH